MLEVGNEDGPELLAQFDRHAKEADTPRDRDVQHVTLAAHAFGAPIEDVEEDRSEGRL